jgi:hypothetical protein
VALQGACCVFLRHFKQVAKKKSNLSFVLGELGESDLYVVFRETNVVDKGSMRGSGDSQRRIL